jgi:hypothetical protein
MQTLRTSIVAVALALAPVAAFAQAQVVGGQTVLMFDHDGLDTTGYELCVDTLTACTPITVTQVGTTNVRTFVAPVTLLRGDRVLRVRALGPGGTSDPGDAATFRVYVKPGKPGNVRVSE